MAQADCKNCYEKKNKEMSMTLLNTILEKQAHSNGKSSVPVEDLFVINLVKRTGLAGKRIVELANQVCKSDNCSSTQHWKTCFFTEMSKFDREIDGSVLKTCIYIMMLHHNQDYRVTSVDAFSYLFPEESQDIKNVLKIPATKFAERMKRLPHLEALKQLMKELGFYLTWVRALSLNIRKFVKIAEKSVPPYFDQDDRLMATHLHNISLPNFSSEHKEKLAQAHETTMYQKAFLGETGFYGIFYQFLYLTLKSLNPGPLGNLKLHFWMFDMDTRRSFIGMQELMKFEEIDHYQSTMPLVWFRSKLSDHVPTSSRSNIAANSTDKSENAKKSITDKSDNAKKSTTTDKSDNAKKSISDKLDSKTTTTVKCVCGRPSTRSFFVITGDYSLPIDLNFQFSVDNYKFEEINYCDQLCYLKDLAKMIPALQEAIRRYENGFTSDKENRHHYQHACYRLNYTSVRADMNLLMRTAAKQFQSNKSQPKLKEVESEGFSWNSWKPFLPKGQKTTGKRTRFCWSPKCPTVSQVAESKLKLCSLCRKARYCSRNCAESNWEDHREYCFNRAAKKALRKANASIAEE